MKAPGKIGIPPLAAQLLAKCIDVQPAATRFLATCVHAVAGRTGRNRWLMPGLTITPAASDVTREDVIAASQSAVRRVLANEIAVTPIHADQRRRILELRAEFQGASSAVDRYLADQQQWIGELGAEFESDSDTAASKPSPPPAAPLPKLS